MSSRVPRLSLSPILTGCCACVQVDRAVKHLASLVDELAEKQDRVSGSLECHIVVSPHLLVRFTLHNQDSSYRIH